MYARLWDLTTLKLLHHPNSLSVAANNLRSKKTKYVPSNVMVLALAKE
jgi:hypothetical protein